MIAVLLNWSSAKTGGGLFTTEEFVLLPHRSIGHEIYT